MQPVFNGRLREPDAAAGIGWIEYMAWRRWHDPSHREAAQRCLDFLQRRGAGEGSPLYEILLYYAPVLAARFNAEEDRRYDVAKLMGWCFSENQQPGVPRRGWASSPSASARMIASACKARPPTATVTPLP